MTFCASSAGDFAHWHTPFLLLLSHRHGAAVGLFHPRDLDMGGGSEVLPPGPLAPWLQGRGWAPAHGLHCMYLCRLWQEMERAHGGTTGVYRSTCGTVSVAFGVKTAEHLASTTAGLLEASGVPWCDLGAVVAGLGPKGSFTGLRLGAAYANGLALGLGIPRYRVPSFLPQDLVSLDPRMPPEEAQVQWPVGWADLVASLAGLGSPECLAMAPLEPLYGALPGPVALLLQKQKPPLDQR